MIIIEPRESDTKPLVQMARQRTGDKDVAEAVGGYNVPKINEPQIGSINRKCS